MLKAFSFIFPGFFKTDSPMSTNTQTYIIPRHRITIAPTLAVVPMLGDVAAKFSASPKADLKKLGADIASEHHALKQSLEEHGIKEAVPVTLYDVDGQEMTADPGDHFQKVLLNAGRKIVAWDGRHRLEWAASKGAAMKVPVRFVTEKEGQALLELTVIGRRHWTKGQRAWLGILQHPEAAKAEAGRPKKSDSVGIYNATTLAARLGVSADLVAQAGELYAKFYAPGAKAGSPEAIEAEATRARFEHLIWGGAGLGAILAGIGGGKATTGKPKAPTGFHHLDAPLASLTRLSKHWMEWDEGERDKAQSLIAARIRGDEATPGWPQEFCLAIAEALAAAGV